MACKNGVGEGVGVGQTTPVDNNANGYSPTNQMDLKVIMDTSIWTPSQTQSSKSLWLADTLPMTQASDSQVTSYSSCISGGRPHHSLC